MNRSTKNVRQMVKIQRGGERFWCELLSKDESTLSLRCDNQTVDPASPKFNDVFNAPADEPILDSINFQPKLSVIQGGAS